METVQPYVIPTISKSKISHHLSYPVGAAAVSTALASVPQLPELKLHFYFWSDHSLRRGHYEFLRVEYLNSALPPAADWPIWLLYSRPPQYRWEIVVQAVPRVNRHRIKEYILKTALPQLGIWLSERAGLSQQGNDMLAFFYDKAEKFESRPLTRLEPLRRS